MPQMMPLNWIFMFTQLTMILMTIMILLFFLSSSTPPHHKNSYYSPQTSWKW